MKFKTKKDKTFRQLTVGLKTQLCKECKEMGRRLCEVDGEPAYFHRWADADMPLLHCDTLLRWTETRARLIEFKKDGLVYPDCHTEIIRTTFALVEFLDGSVKMVDPKKVRFLYREAER